MSNLRNFRVVFSSVVLSWGVAVFVRFLMPRTLGPEILGDYGTAEAWAAMLGTVAGWGFAQWISVNFAAKNAEKSDAVAIVQIHLLFGLLGVVLLPSLAWFLGYGLRPVTLLALLSLGVIATQIAESASRLAEAEGRYEQVARIANPLRVSNGLFSASALSCGFFGLITPYMAAVALGIIIGVTEAFRGYRVLRLSNISILGTLQLGRGFLLLKDAMMLFVLGATPVVFSRVPQIILSKVPALGSVVPTGAAELGVLTAALSLTIPLGVLVLGIQRVMVPALARAREGGASHYEEVFSDGATVVMVVVGIAASTLIMSGNLIVTTLFGERFFASRGVLTLTLLTVVVQYGSLLLVSSSVVWRKERVAAYAAFFAFPFNVGLLVFLLRSGLCSSGAEAVAWSALCYELLVLGFVALRLRPHFAIARRAYLAFGWALLLASMVAVVARHTIGYPEVKQLLMIASVGSLSLVLTALLFGKNLLRIVRLWKSG
jgi:O-antigen/teichoic acid export membrane protein